MSVPASDMKLLRSIISYQADICNNISVIKRITDPKTTNDLLVHMFSKVTQDCFEITEDGDYIRVDFKPNKTTLNTEKTYATFNNDSQTQYELDEIPGFKYVGHKRVEKPRTNLLMYNKYTRKCYIDAGVKKEMAMHKNTECIIDQVAYVNRSLMHWKRYQDFVRNSAGTYEFTFSR